MDRVPEERRYPEAARPPPGGGPLLRRPCGPAPRAARRPLHRASRRRSRDCPRAACCSRWLLTALNYLVLTGYDQLAVAYAGLRLHRGRVALAGFVSYAISNSLGFGMLSGAAVRFRFYTRWGVGALELSKIVLFQSTTFWLGLLVLGGATLGFAPHPWLRDLPAAPLVRALGLALLGLGLAYALLPLVRKAPLRFEPLRGPRAHGAPRGGAVRALDPRLGPRRRGPLGAAAAGRGAVWRVAGGVPRGADRGAREPRPGRARASSRRSWSSP